MRREQSGGTLVLNRVGSQSSWFSIDSSQSISSSVDFDIDRQRHRLTTTTRFLATVTTFLVKTQLYPEDASAAATRGTLPRPRSGFLPLYDVHEHRPVRAAMRRRSRANLEFRDL